MSNKVLIPSKFEKVIVVSLALEMMQDLPFLRGSKRHSYRSDMMESLERLNKEVRKDLGAEELNEIKKYLWEVYREGNILKIIHDSYVEVLLEENERK